MRQNVSKSVWLTAFKNQAKIQSHSEDRVQGGERKNEKLRNIGHSTSMVLDANIFNLGSKQWL